MARQAKFHTIVFGEPIPEVGSQFSKEDCLIIVQLNEGGSKVKFLYSDGNGKVVELNAGQSISLNEHGKIPDKYLPKLSDYADKSGSNIENAEQWRENLGATSREELTAAKEDLQSKIDTKADNSELQNAKSEIENALSDKLATPTFESFKTKNTGELAKKANANADNIADNVADWQTALSIYTKETAKKELGEKVDKEEGKGLSTNDFTNFYKEKVDDFSNIATADQTIEEGVERTIDVRGRLNITGLEELEEDDITYSKKLVINEDGTLAKKAEFLPFNLNFPSQVTVNHIYPAVARQEGVSEEVVEKLRNFQSYSYERFSLSSTNVVTGTFENIEPNCARLLDDSRVIIEVKGALSSADTLGSKSWFEINNLDNERDWVLKFNSTRSAGLFNSVTLGVKYSDYAIANFRGEAKGWIINRKYLTDTLGNYNFYIMKLSDTITVAVIGENSPVGNAEIKGYVRKEGENLTLFGKVSNGEKLEVSNFEIKYL